MKAYLNDPKIKEEYLSRVIMHREADELIKGVYWEDGKGCAVGCTIHSDEHADYETQLGIPVILAFLEDKIFENLPNSLSKTWPECFLSSINIGSDLEMVWPKFAVWLLGDSKYGVIKYAKDKDEEVRQVIQKIIDLYNKKISGEKIELTEWTAAAAAADPVYAGAASSSGSASASAYASASAAAAAYAAAYGSAAASASASASGSAAAAAYAAAGAYAGPIAVSAYAAAYGSCGFVAISPYDATYAYYVTTDYAKIDAVINQSEKLLELLKDAK